MSIRSLDDLNAQSAGRASELANLRMQLWVIGETHRLMGEFAAAARRSVSDAANDEGKLDGLGLYRAQTALETAWGKMFAEWNAMFARLRIQAASIPFGVMAVQHRAFVLKNLQAQGERRLRESESTLDYVFNPQLQEILDAAARRVYGDGLQLSQRIWRLDQQSLQGIRAVLYNGVANGLSAWDIAQELEQYLGAGKDCPRWTRTRLNKLTKAEIAAGDPTGLVRGEDCNGQGVAYNALRLARNEIQVAHAAATDDILDRMPWVEQEQIKLSQSHAERDKCDDIANGGANGDGVYPKNTIVLPIHPQCVTPGQRIETLRGNVPIENVRVNDFVLTHAGRYKKVCRVWKRRHMGNVFKIKTANGEMELTGNHPILLRRGWVNAEAVQIGDEVAHARVNVLVDCPAVVAEHMPTLFAQPRIAARIPGAVMPTAAVTLNRNLEVRDGKVNKVLADNEFAFVGNATPVQRAQEGKFQLGRMFQTAFSICKKHGFETGVVDAFDCGDFTRDPRVLGGNDACSILESAAGDFAEQFTDVFPASPVVPFPLSRNSIAASAQRDVAHLQQVAQDAEGNSVTLKDFWCAESLLNIDIGKEILNGDAILRFDEEFVKFDGGDAVRSKMCGRDARKLALANGASQHDNLLSSSPDCAWGAESGNPVVSEVATPTQARFDYSTVTGIERRDYDGFVHNLSVLDDNTYAVNGMIVHNCLCYKISITLKPDEFVRKLRGWMRGTERWAAMDEYQRLLGGNLNADLTQTAPAQMLLTWLTGTFDELTDAAAG